MALHTALVTGSARRLGLAIARDLAEAGFTIVLHSRDRVAAEKAAATVGDRCAGIVSGDLTQAFTAKGIVGDALKLTGGHLSLLVNNASAFLRRTPERTTHEDWDLELDLGARAPFFMAQAAHPTLVATKGMVLNISDYSAPEGWPAYTPHSAAKAALENVTRTLAQAWEGRVRVNAISPPTVRLPADLDDGSGPEHQPGAGARHGFIPASAVTSTLLELYMSDRTGEVVRLGTP